MTPPRRVRRCGATAADPFVAPCDRPTGHAGPHRGYLSTVDTVEFWPNDDDPDDPRRPAPGRITRDEDEE